MKRLPDFVVLGQGKAGTSLIYRVFKRNPDVGLSQPKELFFYNQNFDKGLEWYLSHFAHVEPDVARLGEICPAYLDPEVVERIHATLGDKVGMIFVLRHPIEQAYSRYLQNICAAQGKRAFAFKAKAVLANRCEQLHAALETLYRLYAPDRILPLIFEQDVDVAPPLFEAKVCDFLGLPRSDHMHHFSKRGKVNAGVMPRFVYGGETGMRLLCEGEAYDIPAGELVFCAQARNSASFGQVDVKEAEAAQARSAKWMNHLSEEEFAHLQNDLVLPFTERLERDFGLDLSHWRVAPRRIAYDLAPPPAEYLAEGNA